MIFKCRNCGGNIVYNPDKGTMCCPHCESLDSEDKLISTEYMHTCANCGAPMEEAITQYTSATKCPSCGTYVVLDRRVEDKYKPDLVLPFKISKEKAIERLRAEFVKRAFTPSGFLSNASVEKIEGNYVPFFMYDYKTHSDYHGTGTKVRKWTSGGYEYTETSYYDIYRQMDAEFDRLPVDASTRMEDKCMDLLEPFNYAGLENFEEKYLSGFVGEVYNQNSDELSFRAKEKASEAAETIIRNSISGYSTVTKNRQIDDHNLKKVDYALLPVWEYVFRFRGEDYKFHVNGQTGKVVGRTPVDKSKVVYYGITVFGLVTILGYCVRAILTYL